jgi:hypothetical protein
MFIKIKGKSGNYKCIVDEFYKENLDYLKEKIRYIYAREYGIEVPTEYNHIKTIKALKEFIKNEMKDMDNYPFGFKYINGVYCVYEAIC